MFPSIKQAIRHALWSAVYWTCLREGIGDQNIRAAALVVAGQALSDFDSAFK